MRKGQKMTMEQGAKDSAVHMGHPVSAETRAKLSASLKGRQGHPVSPEARAKISAARKGIRFTPDHRAKLSAAKKGMVGDKSPSWRGGKYVDPSNGYVKAWVASRRRTYEHRVVMERIIGRPLNPGEVVHHINRDRMDNRPENLMLFASNSDHKRHHLEITRATRPRVTAKDLIAACLAA